MSAGGQVFSARADWIGGAARFSAQVIRLRSLFVAFLIGLVLIALNVGGVDERRLLEVVSTAFALTTVAIGAVCALSCMVLGQLLDDARGLWLGVGLTLYSMVGIPAATINTHAGLGEAPFANVRLAAQVMLVASVFSAVFVAARPSRDGSTPLLVGLSVMAVAGGLGVRFPEASLVVSAGSAVRYGVCAVWLVSGLVMVLAARSPRTGWQIWAGIGCTVIAVAHTLPVGAGAPVEPGMAFSTLRLVGVGVVLVGVVPAARRAVADAFESRLAQLAELSDVRAGLQEAAHRDHEVRNSLNVLTSATMLLNSDDRDAADLAVLRAAVAAELARLNELHNSGGPGGRQRAPRDYDVVSVVRQRVTLAASTGMDVRMVDVDPRLRVHGDPSVLSQVLTNVLINCERHASGSPVRITGSRRGGTAVLRVCDFGPGVPAELEPGIFECGTRGSASPGQGFGLYLARRMLAAEGGRITLTPRPGGVGCTVMIELPLTRERPNDASSAVVLRREVLLGPELIRAG